MLSSEKQCQDVFKSLISQLRSSKEEAPASETIGKQLKDLLSHQLPSTVRDAIFKMFLRWLSQLAENLSSVKSKELVQEGESGSGKIKSHTTSISTYANNNAKETIESKEMTERAHVVEALLSCLQLGEQLVMYHCLAFGDLLDLYVELLDGCSLVDAISLCGFFLSRRPTLRSLLDAQPTPNGQRVARARLLGIANAFERKLKGFPGSTTLLARLRLYVMDVMPKCFHGLCNRAARDTPPQHFPFPTLSNDVDLWGPVDISDVEEALEDNGSASDSSSGSVRNFQQTGDKRRRTATATDVSNGIGEGSSISPAKPKKRKARRPLQGAQLAEIEKRIFTEFWSILSLVQDPVTVLSSSTIGDALKLIKVMSETVQLFKLHPVEPLSSMFSQLPTSLTLDQVVEAHHDEFFTSSVFNHINLSTAASGDLPKPAYMGVNGCRFKPSPSDPSMSFANVEMLLNNTPSVLGLKRAYSIDSSPQTAQSTDSSSITPQFISNALSLLIGRSSFASKPTFSTFKTALHDESFRRSILHRFSAFVRGLKVKSKRPALNSPESLSAFDSLPTELKSAIKSFSDSLYRLLKRLPAIPTTVSARINHEGLPWFLVPDSTWSPIETLSTLGGEFDAQEVIMARWKRDGCNEPKLPSWKQIESDVQFKPFEEGRNEDQESLPLIPSELFQTLSPAVGISIKKPKSSSLNPQLLSRWKAYSTNFIPVLSLSTTGSLTTIREIPSQQQQEELRPVQVVGAYLAPPKFSRERVEWYLPAPPNTKPFKDATVVEKLYEKFEDHKAKVVSDDDPVNEIEEAEKIVKDPLFQWRCHRLLNLTNLQLYDHSNQDKELRSKIREANVEDLIQVVIRRSMITLPVADTTVTDRIT